MDVIDLAYWNLPDFHAEKIKVIYDDVMKKQLETGTDKLKYSMKPCVFEFYNKSVADFLTNQYGDEVKSTDLFATYGASFGFVALITQFFEKGDPCIFEELTFSRASKLAKSYGLNIKSVPHNENNDIDIPILEGVIKESFKAKPVNAEKPWNGCIYLIASMHNPKGTSLSEECCKSVIELARKYNYLVICDDIYNVYDFTSTPKKRMLYYDKLTKDPNGPGHVVSNGSLSKIVFPSFRMGWIEGSQFILDSLVDRPDHLGGGGFNILNQRLAAGILTHPNFLNVHNELKEIYQTRQEKACKFLKEHLPDGASFRWPDGSFFIWVKLPPNTQAKDVVEACKEKKVIINAGTNYSFDFTGGSDHIRIAYSNVPEKTMYTGLQIVCDVMKLSH